MNTLPLALPYQVAGLQDKAYLAPPSLLMTYKLDIYKNPGLLSTNNNETNIDTTLSGALSADVTCIVSVSSTKVFIFAGTTIYVYNPFTATTSTLGTSASEAVINAFYFGGYIYFASSTKLGRIDVSTNAVTNSWDLFTQSPTVRPMVVLDGILYIGNGKYVALVDESATFTEDALDFRADLSVRALYGRGNELYVGLASTLETAESMAVRWNTWSESFSMETIIPEDDIIAFMSVGGGFFVLTNSANGAKVYQYSEPDCVYYCAFPFASIGTVTTLPHNAVAEWNGRVYIGVHGASGAQGGVYSFGSPLGGSPVFAYEYEMPGLASAFNSTTKVTCIGSAKDSIYWGFLNTGGGATYQRGVAKIGAGQSANWMIKSSVIQVARGDGKLPVLRLFFASKNPSGVVTVYVTDFYNSTQYTMIENLPLQLLETDRFKESSNHALSIVGTGGYINVTGAELLFN